MQCFSKRSRRVYDVIFFFPVLVDDGIDVIFFSPVLVDDGVDSKDLVEVRIR